MISINTALEVDIFGNVNSIHVLVPETPKLLNKMIFLAVSEVVDLSPWFILPFITLACIANRFAIPAARPRTSLNLFAVTRPRC